MTSPEKRPRDEASGDMELEIQESSASEGDHEGYGSPLAEGTSPHDASECSNVVPEPPLVEDAVNIGAGARPGLPSFAQSEFYTVMFYPIDPAPRFDFHIRARVLTLPRRPSAQIVRRQRRERGNNNLKMMVSHSRVPHLNAEWEFSVKHSSHPVESS